VGNVRGGSKGQAGQWFSPALRKRIHLGVALACLLLLVGVSVALANEPGEAGPPMPTPVELEEGLNVNGSAIYEAELTNPEAAEELPHVDLGRGEALELMSAVFNPALQNSAGIFDELDVEKFHADNVAVIAAGEQPDAGSEAVPSDQPTLLTSTIPLATRNSAGEREAVDLSLQHVDGELQPVNPLVDVGIPGQLDQGISLPDTGIEVNLVGATADRAPSIAEKSTAFFPNVAPDTDLTVAPTPDGVETLTQLRSPDAPRSQTFELSVPGDADLIEAAGGGAKVIQDGKAIVVIPPPTAYDAEGASVPVSLEVTGSSLTITASPPEDASYPVLVDPLYEQPYVWMWNHTFAGMLDWRRELNAAAKTVPYEFDHSQEGYINGVGFFPGLTISTGVGTVPVNSQAKWYYLVPRYATDYEAVGVRPTSFIRTFSLHRLWYSVDDGLLRPITGSPVFRFGLWNVGNENWTAEGHRYGTEGNLHDLDYMYNALNPNEQVGAKIALIMLDAYESQLQYRQIYAGEAAIELSDKDAPEFVAGGLPAKWVNTKSDSPIPFTAVDPGLGVKEIVVKHPNGAQVATKASCTGISSSPCPRTWGSTSAALPAVGYAPDLLPQGENWVKVEAVDPIGRRSPEEGHGIFESRIKVDHTPPKLALSGTLVDHSSSGAKASQYTLKYTATDGDSQAATALTPFGSGGTAPGQMQEPRGIATDASGSLWVVDRANARVMKYDSNGNYLMQFGSFGSGNGQFNDPRGIAIAPNGTIWVSDMGNNSVQAFNASGQFIRKITTDPGLFVDPYGVAIGPGGVVWVSDITSDKLIEFSEDGTFIRSVVIAGGNEAKSATGLVTDAVGNVWLVDYVANRVQKYSSNGSFLMQFGSTGAGAGQLENPLTIAVAPSGHLLVTEEKNNRVDVFQPNGVYLRQFGAAGSGNSGLSAPKGIALGAGNTAFIVDPGNHRVVRWSHADLDRQSGAASTEVKVDGQTVEPKYAPGCATENCSINNREWTVKANAYASGQHKVEVIASDGVGLSTLKELTLTADSSAPTLTAVSSFFTMPKGWVEQKTYSYSTTFSDVGGYGVTSLVYKLDGKVAASTTQPCPNGGCSATLAGSINMAAYDGGAHPAELIATDAAGNIKKFAATVNVDPNGQVSTAEAVDTLEAVETTSPVNLLGESEVEEGYEGTAPGLGIEQINGELQAIGTQVPMAVGSEPDDGAVLQILQDRAFASPCETAGSEEEPEESEEPEEESKGGEELDEPCLTSVELNELEQAADPDSLTPIELTPTATPPGATENSLVDGVATIAANTDNHSDTVIRPLIDGGMTFENIRDKLGPESFSWEVSLEPGQELQVIDGKHVQVYYEGGHPAFSITAIPAHDAVGTTVPTKLMVTGDHIVTLIVEHRAQAFVYPIIAGAGWEGGFQTFQVEMPPPEEEEEEEWEMEFESPPGEAPRAFGLLFGPPKADTSPVPFAASQPSVNRQTRAYNFVECGWYRTGPEVQPPKAPPKELSQTIQGCHGERLEEYHVLYAISLSGVFHYKWGHWVWVNEPPNCRKWGPREPALVHCFVKGDKNVSADHIDVIGDFKFPPRVVSESPQAMCYRLNGVIPVRPGDAIPGDTVLHGKIHNPHYGVWPGDPCQWGNFPYSLGH
jgi:streptogramin lyase